MYVIYGLEDPRDHLYHYIGLTHNVYKRFVSHLTGDGGNLQKNGWIWECRQVNIMIVMRELEKVGSIEEAKQRERFWISYYLHLGHPLQNHAVVQSLLEEKAQLETQYRRLTTSKAQLEKKISQFESQKAIEKAFLHRATKTKPVEVVKILQLHQQGYSLRQITSMTGISYYYVQKYISEHNQSVINITNSG